jgi:hypothetical protein
MLKGREAHARYWSWMAYGRHRTHDTVASGEEKTLKVALKCKRGDS